jgi:hypothetical protein
MRRSLAMAGAALGVALAVAGCRQRTEPVDRDVNVSHHRTARAGPAHLHRKPVHRGGLDFRPGASRIRAKVARDVPPVPGRRPPARPQNGCATIREPGHGTSVRCVQGSGDDVVRSHSDAVRSHDKDDRSQDDVLREPDDED